MRISYISQYHIMYIAWEPALHHGLIDTIRISHAGRVDKYAWRRNMLHDIINIYGAQSRASKKKSVDGIEAKANARWYRQLRRWFVWPNLFQIDGNPEPASATCIQGRSPTHLAFNALFNFVFDKKSENRYARLAMLHMQHLFSLILYQRFISLYRRWNGTKWPICLKWKVFYIISLLIPPLALLNKGSNLVEASRLVSM